MYYIGVDLGGTKILTGVVDSKGKIMKKMMVMTRRNRTWEKIGDEIIESIKEVTKSCELKLSEIKRIGIGIPGALDRQRLNILIAPNLHWKNVPFRDYIYSRINIPVKLENDVNLATLGVNYFGEGKSVSSLIGIFVGTGIGAGIIIDGKLLIGNNGTAGEFGHMKIQIGGYRCGCGSIGCWETRASRIAIYRKIDEYLKNKGKNNEVGKLFSRVKNKGKAVIEGYKMGMDVVVDAVDETSRFLGIGLGSIMSMFNPEMIALGGGVIDDLSEFMMPVIKEYAEKYAIYGSFEGTKIIHTSLGGDAGMLGAAALAMSD